jgi:F-type H+-transporting ATPase subunit b
MIATIATVTASGGSIIDLDVTFLILFGLFFVVMLILTTLLFKPMFAVLDERRRAVEGATQESKKLRKEANIKKQEYEDRVAEVKREAGDERESMRLEARKAENEILEKGRADAQKSIDEARGALSAQIEEARKSLDAESSRLGETLAERILGQISGGGML